MLRRIRLTLAVVFTCTLVACGGGGGGGSSNPPPPSPNTAPTFGTTTFNMTEDTVLAVTVTATDAQGQAITFSTFTIPAHGTISGFTTSGTFTYRPAPNYFGTDTFLVSAVDSAGAQRLAEVAITVAGVDDVPTIRDDVLTASGIHPIVDVLANDTEPDGEVLNL